MPQPYAVKAVISNIAGGLVRGRGGEFSYRPEGLLCTKCAWHINLFLQWEEAQRNDFSGKVKAEGREIQQKETCTRAQWDNRPRDWPFMDNTRDQEFCCGTENWSWFGHKGCKFDS